MKTIRTRIRFAKRWVVIAFSLIGTLILSTSSYSWLAHCGLFDPFSTNEATAWAATASSSSSDSEQQSRQASSFPTNTKRGAALAEEPARTLYAGKVKEYLACFGTPSTTKSSISKDSWIVRRMTGLCVAELIDFAQDGSPELFLVYYDQSYKTNENNPGIPDDLMHYVTEVWEYSGNEITCAFQASTLELANGGLGWSRVLYNADDGYVLVDDGYAEHPLMKVYGIYRYQNGRLEVTDTFGLEHENYLDSTFFVGEKTGLSRAEFSDFYSQYFARFDDSATLKWNVVYAGRNDVDAIMGLCKTLYATYSTLALLEIKM